MSHTAYIESRDGAILCQYCDKPRTHVGYMYGLPFARVSLCEKHLEEYMLYYPVALRAGTFR